MNKLHPSNQSHPAQRIPASPPTRPAPPNRPPQPAQPARPTSPNQTPHRQKPHKSRLKILLIFAAILIIAALAVVIIFQQQKLNNSDGNQAARKTQDQVAKIMILPNEEALVSDIEDAENIKEQPFFAGVENGDKVLVFAQSAKIIVYRPSTNQIVNAGPIVDDRIPEDPNN